ncbi:MAG: hypothetical protein KDC67_09290, partial [Ignavibacteriae bacterium]|nr:hypothetical protein [Ignavibacteriota bacterium]
DISEYGSTENQEKNNEISEDIMTQTYELETTVRVNGGISRVIEYGLPHRFDMSVKIHDEYNREALQSTFIYMITADDLDVDNLPPSMKLTFNDKVAIVSFDIIPKKLGETKMHVDLFQNFSVADSFEISFIVK